MYMRVLAKIHDVFYIPSSVHWKVLEIINITLAISTPSTLIVISEYYFPPIGTKTAWKNIWLVGMGQEIYKMSLEHFIIPEGKEAVKHCLESYRKDSGANLKQLLLCKDGKFDHQQE